MENHFPTQKLNNYKNSIIWSLNVEENMLPMTLKVPSIIRQSLWKFNFTLSSIYILHNAERVISKDFSF